MRAASVSITPFPNAPPPQPDANPDAPQPDADPGHGNAQPNTDHYTNTDEFYAQHDAHIDINAQSYH